MADRKIFAIVLAAGSSSRFGRNKQLQEYRSTPLVRRAVRLAESVCGARSLLVTGHDWQAVFNACAPLKGFLAHNANYASGLGGSIAVGVRSVAKSTDAVLLLLADQPLVTKAHLKTLITDWQASCNAIVATAFAETTGPPVLFPSRYFSKLTALQGDRGAHPILAAAANHVRQVPFEPAAVDIDRPGDLARLP